MISGEVNNLASVEIDKRNELSTLLSDYLRNVDAQMPVDKSSGEHILWPDQVK